MIINSVKPFIEEAKNPPHVTAAHTPSHSIPALAALHSNPALAVLLPQEQYRLIKFER